MEVERSCESVERREDAPPPRTRRTAHIPLLLPFFPLNIPLQRSNTQASFTMPDQQHLAYAVARWLRESNKEAAAKEVEKAFDVDVSAQAAKFGTGPGLAQIFDVFLKTQSKVSGGAPPAAAAAPAASAVSRRVAAAAARRRLIPCLP